MHRSYLVLFALWTLSCASVPIPSPPLAPDPGAASQRPLAPLAAGPDGWLRVLVELREQVDLGQLVQDQIERGLTRSQAADETRRALIEVAARGEMRMQPLLEELNAAGWLDFSQHLRFRNRMYLSVRRDAVEPLRASRWVAEVIGEFDSVREARRNRGQGGSQAAAESAPIPPGPSWAIEQLGLEELWQAGIDGRGVEIGLLDSGVMGNHAALSPAAAAPPFWIDPIHGRPRPIDTVPHGTQVLSCALGRKVGARALGAAPAATWVAALANLRNSYNNVNMSLAADWMIFEARPDVVLGAWGHGAGSCDPRDQPMVDALRATGIVPVFAAGNDGPDPSTAQTPAALSGFFKSDPGALSVGSIDQQVRVAEHSSRGPVACDASREVFPDLVAPGTRLPVPSGPTKTSLMLVDGTSYAIGWVAGTVAMMQQVAPEMPVWEIEAALRATARDLGEPGPDPHSGYGLLEPSAAVAAAKAWNRARDDQSNDAEIERAAR